MFEHETVLKEELVESLHIKPDGIYVDCTLGGAGHALSVVSQLNENGRLIGFDQDVNALHAATERLSKYEDRTVLIHSNFRYIKTELNKRGFDEVDGIFFDLGVSSPQLDEKERGFSYQYDAHLDMRMNQNQTLSAYDVVNEWSYEQLVSIFFNYGEERFSKQIARKIEEERKVNPIQTTYELVEIIKDAIPAPARRKGGHPAKRTFQAIRIAVNDELKAFHDALQEAARIVGINGRVAVITFHSLEDRLCKRAFQTWSTRKEVPRGMPIIPEGFEAPFKQITRRPIVPSEDEVKRNRRSRSAKLRVVEKIKLWDEDFVYEEGWRR